MRVITLWLAALFASCTWLIGLNAYAASFPERPVHLFLGFAPGGGTDFLARLLAQKLSEKWGQTVIVENRPGADGTIAADLVAHAAPDGYSIFMATTNHTVTPSQLKLNFDAVKSFSPITLMVSSPEILVINPSLPVGSVKEFVALAKSKPGQLNFGSAGAGSISYLAMALLMQQTGINLVHVPFPGGAPLLASLLGGEIQVMFGSLPETSAQAKIGKLKMLAVSTAARVPELPELQTVAEAVNLPNYQASNWYGLLAPAGVPKDIVNKLHDDILAVVNLPDVQATLRKQSYSTVASSPAEFGDFLTADVAKWAAALHAANAK